MNQSWRQRSVHLSFNFSRDVFTIQLCRFMRGDTGYSLPLLYNNVMSGDFHLIYTGSTMRMCGERKLFILNMLLLLTNDFKSLNIRQASFFTIFLYVIEVSPWLWIDFLFSLSLQGFNAVNLSFEHQYFMESQPLGTSSCKWMIFAAWPLTTSSCFGPN